MVKRKNTRLKTIDLVDRGRSTDTRNVQLVSSQSSDQSRSCSIQELLVPVVDSNNNPRITKGGKEVPSLLFTGKILTKQSWRLAMKKILIAIILCCIGCGDTEYKSVTIKVPNGANVKEKEKFVIDIIYFTADVLEGINKDTDFYTSYDYMNDLTVFIYDVTFIDVYPEEGTYVYARASCLENMIWLGWYHNVSLIHEFLHILECRYDNVSGNSKHTGIWWEVYEPLLERIWLESGER